MRILTRPNVGGPTRQAVALWHEFAALGWQTLLVVGRCEGEAAFDLRRAGIPELALDAVDRASAGFVELPLLRRGLHPLRDPLVSWRLGSLVRAFAPDVVHTHTSKAGVLGRQAAWETEVAVVAHTFHGHVLQDYFGRWRSRLVRWVERRLARRTDLLFAVSPSCRDELVAYGVAPAERIEVVPPAVETVAFAAGSRTQARAELGLADDVFVLGFVGRLVPIKRPQWFGSVVAQIDDAVGLVFGDGPLRQDLAAQPRLHLLGATARLAELLPACDVLVFTSVREGCPLAAVEAFAAGVPVVGLSVPGVRDVLGAWGHGVLVEEAAGVDGLVAACAELRAPERRAAVAADARQAVGRFAPAAVAQQLASAYEGTLAAAAQRRPRFGIPRTQPGWLDHAAALVLQLVGLCVVAAPFADVVPAAEPPLWWDVAAVGTVVFALAAWRALALRGTMCGCWMAGAATLAAVGLGLVALRALGWL
ncbi:MAG: glycosyltransferase [Planctomycetota bacterium]